MSSVLTPDQFRDVLALYIQIIGLLLVATVFDPSICGALARTLIKATDGTVHDVPAAPKGFRFAGWMRFAATVLGGGAILIDMVVTVRTDEHLQDLIANPMLLWLANHAAISILTFHLIGAALLHLATVENDRKDSRA